MTCALCARESVYSLDISKSRFPFRSQYGQSLCEDHKQFVIKLLDSYIHVYFQNVTKEASVKETKQEGGI